MKNVILLLGILVIVSSGCKFLPSKKAEKAAIEAARKDSLQKDSIKKAEDLALKQKRDEAEKAHQEALRKERELERKNRFHVIAGSFKTPEYAEAYLAKMKNEGYTVRKIKNRYNFEIISIFATDSYSKAYQKIKAIQSENDEYAEMWVYEHMVE